MKKEQGIDATNYMRIQNYNYPKIETVLQEANSHVKAKNFKELIDHEKKASTSKGSQRPRFGYQNESGSIRNSTAYGMDRADPRRRPLLAMQPLNMPDRKIQTNRRVHRIFQSRTNEMGS